MIGKHVDLNGLDTLTLTAMNTSFYFAVSRGEMASIWKEVIRDWVTYVEHEWSRFQTDNELGQLNHLKIGGKMTLSPPLFDILQIAEEYRKKTDGFFSPYLLPQMHYHGYEQSFPFRSSKQEKTVMPIVYAQESCPFVFEHCTGTVTRIAEGQIDLGGIAKGYTVQAAARWLKQSAKVAAGMVDGGGDITVWSDGQKEWKIGVAHPFEQNQDIAKFRLKNGSIATSNVVYRSWTHGKKRKHHILNGKTGLPVESDIVQATVISENCLDAEVAAKLCLMEKGEKLKDHLKLISPASTILLVNKDGNVVVD